MAFLQILVLLACLFFGPSHCHPHHEKEHHDAPPKLIVVSFDGFRWDYLNIVKEQGQQTPNFDRMMREGASIKGGLKNVFITKTFPNHYSIVTGRYEDNHGMVANCFFDPLFNESFSMSAEDASEAKWWDGQSGTPVEPIWKVNERCGCKGDCECERKSGAIFWPGSQVDTLHPTYFLKYNASMPFEDRVSKLMEWFLREEDPINFGLLYFDEPDTTGHHFGPLSKEVALKILQLDGVLGYLLSQLESKNLLNSTDLIVTSDHGMLPTRHTIYLSDYADISLFKVFSSTPVFHIFPLPGQETKVYESLRNISNVNTYLKKDIPPEFHYRDNRRIPPILLSAHPFYELCVSKQQCYPLKGNHGYNNSLSSMHPIFVARGPSFRERFRLQTLVENVDLYPLIATILHLTPPPSDGKLQRVQALLKSHGSPMTSEQVIYLLVSTLIAFVALVFSVCACYHHAKYFAASRRATSLAMQPPPNKLNGSNLKDSQKRLLAHEEGDEDEEDDVDVEVA